MAKRPPRKPIVPVVVEPAPATKRGIILTIIELFKKQDTATVTKEAIFLGTVLTTMFVGGAFQSCHIDSIMASQNAKLDTVRVQLDSTSKVQTDTLKRQYRNWHKSDSILAAHRFDSLVTLIRHKK